MFIYNPVSLGIKIEKIINKIPSQKMIYKDFINIPKMDGK